MGHAQRQLLLLGCAILAIVGAFLGYRLIRPQLGPARVEHDPLKGPRDGIPPSAAPTLTAAPTATVRARLVLPADVPKTSRVVAWWNGRKAETELEGDQLTIRGTAGPGRVAFHVAGCVVVEREVEIAPGAVVDWGTLTLTFAVRLLGCVIDAAGRPVAACVFPRVGQVSMPVDCTDAMGTFSLEGLPYGDAELRVEGKGFVARTARYRFAADAGPAVITVVRGGGVRGIVLDGDGRPAPKAVYVELVDRGDPQDRDRMGFPSIEDDGRFEVRLLAGRYRARATLGHLEATADVDVVDGETRELTLRLRRP